MRTACGWREVCAGAIFFILLATATPPARATPQVVGDDACALYEVDIASFATCEGGRVVLPDDSAAASPTGGTAG
jgi:hypothetical protein